MISQLKDFLTFDLKVLWDFKAGERPASSTWTVEFKGGIFPGVMGYGMRFTHQDFAESGMFMSPQEVTCSHRSAASASESLKGIFQLGGSKKRRPGQYLWNDHGMYRVRKTGGDICNETMHFTVRALVGKGFAPVSRALKDAIPIFTPDSKVIWNFPIGDQNQTLPIPEDSASDYELDLLASWLQCEPTMTEHDRNVLRDETSTWDLPFARELRPLLVEARKPSIRWDTAKGLPRGARIRRTEMTAYVDMLFVRTSFGRKIETKIPAKPGAAAVEDPLQRGSRLNTDLSKGLVPACI
jgi:hypothetical protein